MSCVFEALRDNEVDKIRQLGSHITYKANERIFREGDEADCMYFLDSGLASLYIDKFSTKVEIRQVRPGDWFGELAVYSNCYRTASAMAVEDSSFIKVSKESFHRMLAQESAIDSKIRDIVDRRNEDLVLSEKMVDASSNSFGGIHVGIPGDPSLRESAMDRARYESIVDRFMPQLIKCFEDLLLNRTVHRILIGFNNGEIRLSTLLDPFSEEFHPALRLLDASYVDRHFPKIDYQRKSDIIRSIYGAVERDGFFTELPTHLNRGFTGYFKNWAPVTPEELSKTISQIPLLRNVQNFYVRNLTIGITKDAVHMQFNCDGTHILSNSGYEQFLNENI